mmetsp:Transcript_58369/g.160235  ORF Transcript_58369/g.160235 Transcript_58369/m.160235 type:complete len:213 (-) Transcript_58369:674-1312(-)
MRAGVSQIGDESVHWDLPHKHTARPSTPHGTPESLDAPPSAAADPRRPRKRVAPPVPLYADKLPRGARACAINSRHTDGGWPASRGVKPTWCSRAACCSASRASCAACGAARPPPSPPRPCRRPCRHRPRRPPRPRYHATPCARRTQRTQRRTSPRPRRARPRAQSQSRAGTCRHTCSCSPCLCLVCGGPSGTAAARGNGCGPRSGRWSACC